MQVASDNPVSIATLQGNPAQRMLRALAKRSWRPRDTRTVDQWADAHRILPSETSADAGPWRTARVPYAREVMRMFTDPRVTDITLMWAAQLGKTECGMLNTMFYTAAVLGRSMIVMYPTEDDIKKFRNIRLEPAIKECPDVKALLVGKKPITDDHVKFKGCYLDFAWAGSARTQKGRARGIVYCDEIDEYSDMGAPDRIRNRAKTFPDMKFVDISTPSHEDFGIDRRFKQGDKRRYHVPCPCCGEYQVLTFRGLKWEGSVAAKKDDLLKPGGVWYECQNGQCQERIGERFKPWMVERGVWVPDGCLRPEPYHEARQPHEPHQPRHERGSELPDGSEQYPYPVGSHVSYQLSELYSLFPSATWGGIVAEFVAHKGNPPATFYNERLGEAWSSKGRQIDVHMLQKLAVPRKDGGYLKRDIHRDIRYLLASIDIQHNRFVYLCRGFSAKAEKSYLVDEKEIFFEASGVPVMTQIERFIRAVKYEQTRMVRTSDGVDKEIVQPWRPVGWAVDTGDQTRDAYEGVIVKFYPSLSGAAKFPTVLAFKGRGMSQGVDLKEPFTKSTLGKVGKEQVQLSRAVQLVLVNTVHYKDAIANEWAADPRLGLLVNEEGDAIGTARSFLPGDVSKEYFEELTSEWKKQTGTSKTGYGIMAWVKKPGIMRNERLDLEVYVRCLADVLGATNQIGYNTGFSFVESTLNPGACKTSAQSPRSAPRFVVPGLKQ